MIDTLRPMEHQTSSESKSIPFWMKPAFRYMSSAALAATLLLPRTVQAQESSADFGSAVVDDINKYRSAAGLPEITFFPEAVPATEEYLGYMRGQWNARPQFGCFSGTVNSFDFLNAHGFKDEPKVEVLGCYEDGMRPWTPERLVDAWMTVPLPEGETDPGKKISTRLMDRSINAMTCAVEPGKPAGQGAIVCLGVRLGQ